MIDDIGYVQQSREEMEFVFTLLAERYERGSVILTSSLAFSNGRSVPAPSRTPLPWSLAASGPTKVVGLENVSRW